MWWPKDINIIDTVALFRRNDNTGIFLNCIKLINDKPNNKPLKFITVDGIDYNEEQYTKNTRDILRVRASQTKRTANYKARLKENKLSETNKTKE